MLEHAAARGRDAARDRPRFRFSPRGFARAGAGHATPTRRRRCRCRRSAAKSNSPTRPRARQSSTALDGALPVTRCGAGGRNRERVSCAGRFERHDRRRRRVGCSTSATTPRPRRGSQRRSAACRAAARTWIVFAAMRDKDLAGVVEPFVAWPTAGSSRKRARIAARRARSSACLLESLGAERVVVAADVAAACAAARATAARRRSRRRLRIVPSPWAPRLEALRLYCAASPLVDRPATWTRV